MILNKLIDNQRTNSIIVCFLRFIFFSVMYRKRVSNVQIFFIQIIISVLCYFIVCIYFIHQKDTYGIMTKPFINKKLPKSKVYLFISLNYLLIHRFMHTSKDMSISAATF